MEQKNIIDCYNKTAKNYAERFINELYQKHFDSILLQSFTTENLCKKTIDVGCGPGQTTKYLHDCGLSNIIGVDISTAMVEVAKSRNPHIHFEEADMLQLHYPDNCFGAAIAFYAIVHFDDDQLKTAFSEIKRVLANDGQFLFSFHTGDNTVHLDHFLDHKVNIDFRFFETEKVITLLVELGFKLIDAVERAPYKEIEYPSKRAYIWVAKSR